MSTSSTDTIAIQASPEPITALPRLPLVSLFLAGFVGILTETLPAGLLREMTASLHTTEAAAGQTITLYALGAALVAIPLNVALARWPRKRIIVVALLGLALGNVITAASGVLWLTLVGRLLAGFAAGLIWSNIGMYAARLSPAALQGRAITIALAGAPIGLSLGTPVGTWLGVLGGWRSAYGIVAGLTVALTLFAIATLPNLSGVPMQAGRAVWTVLRLPGTRTILLVLAGFVLAHTILYTYIDPFLSRIGLGDQVQFVLFAFGIAAVFSVWFVGAFIDKHHRKLMVASMVILGAASIVLAAAMAVPGFAYAAAVIWGLSFGGSITLFATAATRVAGESGEVAQALVVTGFNISIGIGGVLGAVLLAGLGTAVLPWAALILMVPTIIATIASKRYAFPAID